LRDRANHIKELRGGTGGGVQNPPRRGPEFRKILEKSLLIRRVYCSVLGFREGRKLDQKNEIESRELERKAARTSARMVSHKRNLKKKRKDCRRDFRGLKKKPRRKREGKMKEKSWAG